jgi:tetratricopeptide (TPR) repeat protein
VTHVRLGRPEKAIDDFSRALDLNPGYVSAWYHRGLTYAGQGLWDKAVADFSRAVELDPTHVRAWYSRGEAHSRRGQWKQAVGDYSQALEHKKDYPEARRGRAAAHVALGRWHKAAADWGLAAYARRLATEPASETWVQAAGLCLLTGDTDSYRELCRQLEKHPGQMKDPHTASLASRSCTLSPAGLIAPSRAVSWAEQAVAAVKTAGHLHALGRAHYRAGQFDQAVRLCRESLEAEPEGPERVLNWLVLALAHQRLGQNKEARQWLAEAVRWREKLSQGKEKTPVPAPGLGVAVWLEFHVLLGEARALVPEKADNS